MDDAKADLSEQPRRWTLDGDTWTLSAPGEEFDGMTLADSDARIWSALYGAGPYAGHKEIVEQAMKELMKMAQRWSK